MFKGLTLTDYKYICRALKTLGASVEEIREALICMRYANSILAIRNR